MDILLTSTSIYEIIPDQDFALIQNLCQNYQDYSSKESIVNFINIFITKYQRKIAQPCDAKVRY